MQRVFNSPIICNDQSVERLSKLPIPVLLLFWDGQQLSDKLDQAMLDLAEEEAGRLIVAKIETRDNQRAVNRFDIRRPPTLVVISGGEVVTQTAGATADDLLAEADNLLGRQTSTQRNGNNPNARKKVYADVTTRPIPVTDATFEEKVLRSPLPVLVDFWAPWCGPCHKIAPALDRLARLYAGKLRVVKVNVEESPHFAGVYGVQGIPTLMLVEDGVVRDRMVGALPEQYLHAKVKQHIKH